MLSQWCDGAPPAGSEGNRRLGLRVRDPELRTTTTTITTTTATAITTALANMSAHVSDPL